MGARPSAAAALVSASASTLVPGIRDSIIDLSGIDFDGNGQTDEKVRAVFNAESFTDYDNTIGFYKVEGTQGAIADPITGETLRPGDKRYAQAALSNRVEALDMNRETGSLMIELEADQILAPFLVADATPEQALQSSSTLGESVFFAYKAANADGLEYVSGEGDRTLKFEDPWGDSDRNFTDFTVNTELNPL